MTSPSAVLTGEQTPAYRLVPPAPTSAGREAVELAASAGLVLDPWQALVLEGALGERDDGKWAAFEVGLLVPRQNGKGAILEGRELAGLFLFGEDLILHSAHEFKTSAEAFRRVLMLIQNTPDLDRRVMRVRTSHGEEGVELKTGQRLRFVARSTGSGRGFSGDTVILDEAYNLPAAAVSALLPTMAARSNPQLWYASSAPLPRAESDTLRRLCKRGREGKSERLAFFEWCASSAQDPNAVAEANPSMGYRISEEFVESERGAMGEEDWERERLGIYPEVLDAAEPPALPAEHWEACIDNDSEPIDPVVLAFEVSNDREWATIAAASHSTQGGTHVEVIDYRQGTGWVVPRLAELVARHRPLAIRCNARGPAGGLLAECKRQQIEVDPVTGPELTQACGAAYDDVTEHRWRHIDQPELNYSVTGAAKRPVGDAWVFDRRGSVEISPLIAVAVAAFGLIPEQDSVYESRSMVAL